MCMCEWGGVCVSVSGFVSPLTFPGAVSRLFLTMFVFLKTASLTSRFVRKLIKPLLQVANRYPLHPQSITQHLVTIQLCKSNGSLGFLLYNTFKINSNKIIMMI